MSLTAPALESDITYSDYFCGWGGSSQGARKRGLRIRMAANHWDLAVKVHNLNFPDADHDQADLSQVDPRRHPRTTIAWFSPECTNHSKAKGRKKAQASYQLSFGEEPPLPDAAADRSRATMWDVVRFAEHHRYRYVIVENVVEVRDWLMFPAWLQAMSLAGYLHQAVYLNSMHAGSSLSAPAPQSRDRVYFVFWQKGERAPDLRITPPAWCARCDVPVESRQSWKKPLQPYGRYRQQYVYVCPGCRSQVEPYVLPAAYAIDWSVLGQRIGDRTRPLKPKTLARIQAGIRRYARPIHLEAAGNTYDAADPKHPQHGNPDSYYRAWPAEEPLRTLHNTLSKAIATPPMLVPAGGTWNDESTSVDEPMRTRTTRETEAVVTPPLLVPTKGHAPLARNADAEVMPTQTTHHALSIVVPPFIAELRGGGSKHRAVTAPLATVVAGGNHHGLVQPPELDGVVMRNNNERGGNGHMSKPVSEPLRTLTTHGHQSLITWQAQYGYDSGILRSLGVPLPTQTTVSGDALLTGSHALPDVDDCLFRMLEPVEIAAGMAFEHGYLVEGTKREQVKGYGNAVTPCASTLLLDRVVDAITGERAA